MPAPHLRLALLVFLVILPQGAQADPVVHLYWDVCANTATPANVSKSFAGPGVYRQVVSGQGFSGLVAGTQIILHARSPGGVGDAWRFDAGGCQAGRATFSNAAVMRSCPSLGAPSIVATSYAVQVATGSVEIRLENLLSGPINTSPGTTYTLWQIFYDHGVSAVGSSGGPDSCGDADRPVCFYVADASYFDGAGQVQPASVGNGHVTWQDDTATATACSDDNFGGIRVDEVGFACDVGDTTVQFVELVSAGSGQRFSSSARLRVRDRLDRVVFDDGGLFPGKADGAGWPMGTRWLLATPGFASASGLAPDRTVSSVLDGSGGTITLYDGRPGGRILHEFRYGSALGTTPPAPGHSLQRHSDDSMVEKSVPDPTTSAGLTASTFQCPTPFDSVRIQEAGFACVSGDASIQFLELVAPRVDQSFYSFARLRVRNQSGQVILDRGSLFSATPDGTVWPAGQTWLFATLGFQAATGVAPDKVLSGVSGAAYMDPAGGTLTLYDGRPGGRVIHEFSYGPGTGVPAPAPGRSLALQADGTMAENPRPSPTNFNGASGEGSECYCLTYPCILPEPPGLRINEFGFDCNEGAFRIQFLELIAPDSDQTFLSALHLQARDRNGAIVLDRGALFPGIADGSPWPAGKTWLLGTPVFTPRTGVAPDLEIPLVFDQQAGRLTLYDARPGGQVLQDVSYGPTGSVPSPRAGHSLQRRADGGFEEKSPPDPTRFDGVAAAIDSCPCPLIRLVCGGLTYSTEPSGARTCWSEISDYGGVGYDLIAGRFHADALTRASNYDTDLQAEDVYQIAGLPAGAPLSFSAVLSVAHARGA